MPALKSKVEGDACLWILNIDRCMFVCKKHGTEFVRTMCNVYPPVHYCRQIRSQKSLKTRITKSV